MFSRMSSKRWAGFLEGTYRLGLYRSLDARLERALFDKLNGLSKKIGKLKLNAGHIEEREPAGVIKDCQQVDIGIGSFLTASRRSEKGQPHYADGTKLAFVRLQGGDDAVPFHGITLAQPF